MNNKKEELREKYLSKKDLIEYMGVSLPTISNYMKAGMPYHKVGRRVLFRKGEIDGWVDNGR